MCSFSSSLNCAATVFTLETTNPNQICWIGLKSTQKLKVPLYNLQFNKLVITN